MTKRKSQVRIARPDPDQITMPGVSPVTLGEKLQCCTDMPVLPRRNQKPREIGFWDPMRDQLDFF